MNKLIVKDFWDNKASLGFQHLITPTQRDLLNKDSKFFKIYNNAFLSKLDWENKIIIDYGIGKSDLGYLLLLEYKIKKYIGIDISDKSINAAKENLKEFEDKLEFSYPLKGYKKYRADIFISLACIQHFPDIDYVNNFFKIVNNSNINYLILQIRNKEEIYFSNDYNSIHGVGNACKLNKNYMIDNLNNYKLISEFYFDKPKYLYTIWELKSE